MDTDACVQLSQSPAISRGGYPRIVRFRPDEMQLRDLFPTGNVLFLFSKPGAPTLGPLLGEASAIT